MSMVKRDISKRILKHQDGGEWEQGGKRGEGSLIGRVYIK